MDISRASFSEDGTNINATINGRVLSVPLEPSNRHYKALQEWEADGNTIDAYAAPTNPANYPLTRVQFETLLIVAGLEISNLEAAIRGLGFDGLAEANALARLRNSQQFHYDNPLVQAVAAVVTLPQPLSDLWMQAASV